MNDYVERDKVLNASKIVYIEYIELDDDGYEEGNAYDIPIVLKKDIEAIPAADVHPVVHGRWVWMAATYDRVPIEKRYECSECHHETITHDAEPWERYCPNCGAKMELEA